MKAAYLPIILAMSGCAYHNPIEASPAAISTSAPATLRVGADGGHITIHVQNAYGDPLANVAVAAYVDNGELSNTHPTTGVGGVATTDWLGHGTTHVQVVVDNLTANWLVEAR